MTLVKEIQRVLSSTKINSRTHLEYLLRECLYYLNGTGAAHREVKEEGE